MLIVSLVLVVGFGFYTSVNSMAGTSLEGLTKSSAADINQLNEDLVISLMSLNTPSAGQVTIWFFNNGAVATEVKQIFFGIQSNCTSIAPVSFSPDPLALGVQESASVNFTHSISPGATYFAKALAEYGSTTIATETAPGAVSGGIQIDTISTNSGDASSFTYSHTVGAGCVPTNRLLIVAVELNDAGGTTVSSITYNGTPMTFVASRQHASGKPRVEVYQLVAPPTGTHDVVVTLSGIDKVTIGAISYTGVDQTTPIEGVSIAEGTSTTPSVIVSSEAGDLVQDAMATIADGSVTPPSAEAGQTARWNVEMGGPGVTNHFGTGSTEDGAASVTMSWTLPESKDWVTIAFNINAA